MAVLFLVGHEHLNHLVPRAGEAVQAAGGDGSTQLVERQRGRRTGAVRLLVAVLIVLDWLW